VPESSNGAVSNNSVLYGGPRFESPLLQRRVLVRTGLRGLFAKLRASRLKLIGAVQHGDQAYRSNPLVRRSLRPARASSPAKPETLAAVAPRYAGPIAAGEALFSAAEALKSHRCSLSAARRE
jgi:hypothetical protein